MPTYQYACTECGHQLEAVQSFTDEPLTQCPACEGRLRKLYSAVGIVFKGSGFYRTDSRNGSGAKSDAPATPAKTEAKPESTTKTESPSSDSTKSSTPAKTPATSTSST